MRQVDINAGRQTVHAHSRRTFTRIMHECVITPERGVHLWERRGIRVISEIDENQFDFQLLQGTEKDGRVAYL